MKIGDKPVTWLSLFIIVVLLFILSAGCLAPGFSQNRSSGSGYWKLMTADPGWSLRSGQSVVVLPDGDILLMGGYPREGSHWGFFNDIWRSSDNGTTWKMINSSAEWSPRFGHSSVVLPDGSVILMGGITEFNGQNDTWRSTDKGTTWTLMNGSSGWSPRKDHTSVVMPDGSIVLIGGMSGEQNDTWRSTDKGTTWTLMNASPGWDVRRGYAVVATHDSSIVLMGGTWLDHGPKNDVWRSDDNGATWIEVTPHAGWSARAYPACVVMQDNSLVLMGGNDATGLLNDMWRSTDHGATWKRLNVNSGWSKRIFHICAVLPDDSILLIGGTDFHSNKKDVWRFVPADSSQPIRLETDTVPVVSGKVIDNRTTRESAFVNELYRRPWTLVNPDAAWGRRVGQSSVALTDGSIVLTGGISGEEGNSLVHNDTWRSTNSGKTWTLMNTSSGWAARSGHTSASLPDGSVVLMGGVGNGKLFNDTWRSADNGKSWTLMNESPGWEARTLHSSVVLPDGSIVLTGGWDGLNLKSDTWRSTDQGASWSLVNASSGWKKRFMHQSVVTHDGRIILIGGYDYSVRYLTDVWLSSDQGATWIQVTKNAGWPDRIYQDTVMMPDDSIVLFGGELENGTLLNDMWRSADDGVSWTEINTSAEWQPRIYHTSVVIPDGSIILMGGQRWNEVWRFQPGTP